MNQLVITLTGTVNFSNFDEWKNDLIAQIQSTNMELVTDEDFGDASDQVKALKLAEKTLKQAKQSAIDQAEEIQKLFSAIDEITEEARQARLSLEHQIRERKQEIKSYYIQSGIEEIQKTIDEQIDEFAYCDTTIFLDQSRFESAISGKAGTKGIQNAIDHLCRQIKDEVSNRAIELLNNKTKFDALPEASKLLFQDWKTLIGSPGNELDLEIDRRIARYIEETARGKIANNADELVKMEGSEIDPERSIPDVIDSTPKHHYRITIDLLSTKDKAVEVARSIKSSFTDDSSISEIKLTRHHEGKTHV